MAELLDPDGAWSIDMVELMLPVALELEAMRTESTFAAVASAAGSLFSGKAAKGFMAEMGKVHQRVRRAQLEARHGRAEEQGQDVATKMLKGFEKFGLKVKRTKPSGAGTASTRIHPRKK